MMTVLIAYLWICLASGVLMFMSFVMKDLKRLYLNIKHPHSHHKYEITYYPEQVAWFVILVTVPVLNLIVLYAYIVEIEIPAFKRKLANRKK